MVDESDLMHEQIQVLKEYIRLLEKVNGVSWGWSLDGAERSILKEIDQRVGRGIQLLASVAGIGVFLLGLVIARAIARSPQLLVAVLALAFVAAIASVVLIYRHARNQAIQQEIRKTQLEIFRLEDRLNE